MSVAVTTTSHRGSLLGIVALLCGVVGAVTTAVLWLFQRRPHAPVLGRYGPRSRTAASCART